MFLVKEPTWAKMGGNWGVQRTQRAWWLRVALGGNPRLLCRVSQAQLEAGAQEEEAQLESRKNHTGGMKPGHLPELPEPARASPDPLGWSLPGACGWFVVGVPPWEALAALSRELLLELGAVVSRCCCSEPGATWALSAGR